MIENVHMFGTHFTSVSSADFTSTFYIVCCLPPSVARRLTRVKIVREKKDQCIRGRVCMIGRLIEVHNDLRVSSVSTRLCSFSGARFPKLGLPGCRVGRNGRKEAVINRYHGFVCGSISRRVSCGVYIHSGAEQS